MCPVPGYTIASHIIGKILLRSLNESVIRDRLTNSTNHRSLSLNMGL